MGKKLKKIKVNKFWKNIFKNRPLMFLVAVFILAVVFSNPTAQQYFRATGSSAAGIDLGGGGSVDSGTLVDVIFSPEKKMLSLYPDSFAPSDIYIDNIVGVVRSVNGGPCFVGVYNSTNNIYKDVKKLTGCPNNNNMPRIFRNTIAWIDYPNTVSTVFKYNIDNNTIVDFDVSGGEGMVAQGLDIYENKVVFSRQKYPENDNVRNIYILNTLTGQITLVDDSPYFQNEPKIHGNYISWTESIDSDDHDIRVHDIKQNTNTTVSTGHKAFISDIYGSKIVWQDARNIVSWFWGDDDNYDIYMYDMKTYQETKLEISNFGDNSPIIFGEYVVVASRNDANSFTNDPKDIKLYSIAKQKVYSITKDDWRQDIPLITMLSQKTIQVFWSDKRDNNTSDLYMRKVTIL